MNALKRSSIAEHLLKNHICAENFSLDRFKIINSCGYIFDLIKLEVICIFIRKSKLYRQNEFDYIVSFFT